jgi:hypothetical protein
MHWIHCSFLDVPAQPVMCKTDLVGDGFFANPFFIYLRDDN